MAPSHEQPVKMQYITVKNTSGLCCSAAHIINKGAPRIIEARARGGRGGLLGVDSAGDEKWKSVYW